MLKGLKLCRPTQVLVLSCGLLDVMDLVWWQPFYTPLEKDGVMRLSTAWLPGAVEIASDPDRAEVRPGCLVASREHAARGPAKASLMPHP